MTNIVNSQPNNVFKDFPQYNVGKPLSAVGVNSQANNSKNAVNTNYSPANEIASVKVSDTEKKRNKGGIVAATVASTIVTAGVVALFFTKGFSSVTYRKINDLIDVLNRRIYDSSITKKSKSYVEKGLIVLAKGVKHVLSGLKSVANFNAIKDSTVDKVCKSNKITANGADKVTKLFKKFATDSVDSAYNKAHIATSDYCADIRTQVAKIMKDASIDLDQEVTLDKLKQTKTLREWLEDLNFYSNKMEQSFKEGFGKDVRNARSDVREKSLKGLQEKVCKRLWNENGGILNFKENINKFKVYVTEDLSSSGKMTLRKEINSHRKEFTNNITHNYSVVKISLQEISDKLRLEDDETRNVIRLISKKMDTYKTLAGNVEKIERDKLVKEISSDLDGFIKIIQDSSSYNSKSKAAIKKQVEFIRDDILNSDKKGALQEVVTLMNALSKKEIKTKDGQVLKSAVDSKIASAMDKKSHDITVQINKATNMESEDLFDKFAEFEVGSAPSDVIGLMIPVAAGAYAISKADDKDERVSTTLTTGIPIVGTIGTMIYGTTKMLAGPKNLIMSTVVGLGLNFVGNICDKLYKQYQEKRSFTQMALDAYRNNPLVSQLNTKQN